MLKAQYYILPKQIQRGINETELWVQVGANSRVSLKGADNEDSLRGLGLDGIIVDEVASMRRWDELWDEVLRPALTDKKGWAWFIGTPKGYNHFYDLYEQRGEEYRSFHFTSYDNPYIDATEIDKARETMTEDAFAQEFMADFRKHTGLVFKDFDRKIHILDNIDLPGIDAYYRGIDFGAVNPTACLFIRVDGDGTMYVYDEYYESGRTTKENAYSILAKHPVTYFRATWGDPSGKQERLDYEGYQFHITPANKRVVDYLTGNDKEAGDHEWVLHRINLIAERLKINPVTRKPRIFIHKNCVNTIREFESYRWAEQKNPELNAKDFPEKADDHTMDALGYMICSYAKIPRRQFKQPPRQIPTSPTGY